MKHATRLRFRICAGAAIALAAANIGAQEPRKPRPLQRVELPARPLAANSESQFDAFQRALSLARAYPNDLGYPWIDESGTVVHRAVTDAGRELARAKALGTGESVEFASASYARLEESMERVMRLGDMGFSYADDIWRVEIDAQRNRVLLTVTKLRQEVSSVLGAEFDANAISVRIAAPVTHNPACELTIAPAGRNRWACQTTPLVPDRQY